MNSLNRRKFPFANVALSAVFILLSTLTGVLLGVLVVRFLLPKAPSGWDGIAQGLGAMMLGALIGIALAAILLAPLLKSGRRALLRAMLAVFVVGFGACAVLFISAPRRPPEADPPQLSPKPTVPVEPSQPVKPPPASPPEDDG